jgi:hypothetical protein
MRPIPLLPSTLDPATWPDLRDAELRWEGSLHPGWKKKSIHALHMPEVAPGELLEHVQTGWAAGAGPDFIVLPVPELKGRTEGFSLLGALEILLQVSQGRVKMALRPSAASQSQVLALLKEARGEAVGFCWQPGVDPELIADRLWCAVAEADSDVSPLQRLGYRWNVGFAASDPEAFKAWSASLLQRFPPVLFPSELPKTALGRPVTEDPDLRFGASWGKP